MTKRRDFLKKAAAGTLAFSPVGSLVGATLPGADQNKRNGAAEQVGTGDIRRNGGLPEGVQPDKTQPDEMQRAGVKQRDLFGRWTISFQEEPATLRLTNGVVSLQGTLKFRSGADDWKVVASRDGVSSRYALVDKNENVQGYWVLNQSGKRLELLFYHRTAQGFKGTFSYEGTVSFLPDAFPCRTRPDVAERVLCLAENGADSLSNDSLFSPADDVLLAIDAPELYLQTQNDGRFEFRMAGQIEEASLATFTFRLEEDYFKNRYVPYYHPIDRKRCPKAPTGWMSWNTYFDTATAEDNLNEAREGQKYLLPFGCEFWSIESWQGNSDKLPVRDFYNMNLEVNEKQFPKGMKKLADDIRALGFRPGLWTAPFGTGNKAFYEAHKNWFLHDKDGQPIGCWNGAYTLDPTVKEAREHLKEIHRKASREWGYEFFKIDGMSGRNHGYCAHMYERPGIKARFHDPTCKNPFELCVQAFREGIGEDRVFLACQGHTSGPEALYADASRIGADIVHPNQPVKWSGVLNQARCLVNQAFTHNIVMVADPDTLLVRDLPMEEARTSATIVALPGQLTFFGDKLTGLAGDKMKILQQTLPVADVRPVSLYPYFRMLPIWKLGVKNKWLGDYPVVAFFNWEDESQTVSVTTKELGIPDVSYTGVEFWTAQPFDYLPADKQLSMQVPAHGVRLVALHSLKNIPQWVGSDRHITQNAMELTVCQWDADANHLTGSIQLVYGFPLTMHVKVPANYTFVDVICKNAQCQAKLRNGLLSVTFTAKNEKKVKKEGYITETPFTLTFNKNEIA